MASLILFGTLRFSCYSRHADRAPSILALRALRPSPIWATRTAYGHLQARWALGHERVHAARCPFIPGVLDGSWRHRTADHDMAFAGSLVGHLRGGLGQVNIMASTLFGGISGSAVEACSTS